MSFDSNEDFAARQAFEEGVRQGRVYGAAAERARLVAWLRGRAEGLRLVRELRATDGAAALDAAADLIEAMKPKDVA